MARWVSGCPTASLQTEDAEKPEQDHQQVERPDAIEGKDILDYHLDVDYEGSECENELVIKAEVKENSDTEYAKMEIP